MIASETVQVLEFEVHPSQQEFTCLRTWVRGFCAGRGAGKTLIGAYDRISKAKDGECHMIVSPTWGDLDDTTWPTFKEVAERMDVWIRGVKTPKPRAWIRTQDQGRAEFVFYSAEVPDRLRGPSKASLWFDEAGLMHEDAFKFGVPVLRYKGKMGPCLMTFTPKGRYHWTFRTFFEHDGEGGWNPIEDRGLIQCRTVDNPFADEKYYPRMKTLYSTGLAQQELEGEFIEIEGLMFTRNWFKLVDRPMTGNVLRVRYWDKAGSEDTGNYTSGTLMSRKDDGLLTVENVKRGQWSYGEREKTILETAHADKSIDANHLIFIEQEGGSGGKESMQRTIKMLVGFNVHRDIVTQGKRIRSKGAEKLPGQAKIDRAGGLQAQAEAGNVQVVRAPWTENFLEELCMFPAYAFTDQVDSTSGAFNKLAARSGFQIDAPTSGRNEPDASRFGIKTRGARGGPGKHSRHGVHLDKPGRRR